MVFRAHLQFATPILMTLHGKAKEVAVAKAAAIAAAASKVAGAKSAEGGNGKGAVKDCEGGTE